MEAITGRRTFYYGELLRLMVAENIANAYHSREHAQSWAEWTESNPRAANLLAEAEKLYNAISNG